MEMMTLINLMMTISPETNAEITYWLIPNENNSVIIKIIKVMGLIATSLITFIILYLSFIAAIEVDKAASEHRQKYSGIWYENKNHWDR